MMKNWSREDIIKYYSGTRYWLVESRARPSAMHTPLFLEHGLEKSDASDLRTVRTDNKINVQLTNEDLRSYAAVQIHEVLFHFHKAFYNYLASRNLYYGGMEHWINITLYYSKFFIARAATTLLGSQAYSLRRQVGHTLFEKVAEALDKPNANAFRIITDIDLKGLVGKFQIDTGKVNSHHDVWKAYRELPRDLGLNLLVFPEESYDDSNPFGIPRDYLTRERNEENYSFDGYMQVDFNLPLETFAMYFERDYIKRMASTLYDHLSGDVLLALSTLYQFLCSLNVPGLPLEIEKLQHMVTYSMPEGEGRDKLLELLREGFDIGELSSFDGDDFYDQQGRTL